MNVPPIFKPFIAATKAAFHCLTSDYGFHLTVERAVGAEAWVVYDNQTTRVTVHYELGAEPWIEIGRLELREGQVAQVVSIGLDLLVRERGRSFDDEVTSPRDIHEPELVRMLSVRAKRLRALGDDLLRGDFRSFSKLQTKAEKELQRREAGSFRSDR